MRKELRCESEGGDWSVRSSGHQLLLSAGNKDDDDGHGGRVIRAGRLKVAFNNMIRLVN